MSLPEPENLDAAPARSKPGTRSWIIAGVTAAVTAAILVGALTIFGHSSGKSTAVTANPGSGSNEGPGTANRQGFGNGVFGKVTKIDGNTLTVAATRSMRSNANANANAKSVSTVRVTSATKITEMVDAKRSDLKVGDNLMVTGETTGSTVTATRIRQVDGEMGQAGPGQAGPGPGGMQPPGGQSRRTFPGGGSMTFGEITAIGPTTITLKNASGDSVTVKTTSDTTISVTKTVDLDEIQVDEQIRATGKISNGTLIATSIRIGNGGDLGFGGGAGFGGPPAGAPS